jgi:hypothetical protein
VYLSWLAPATDGGEPISEYIITLVGTSLSLTVGGSALSATFFGIAPGSTAVFSVAAVNAAGVGPASDPSNSLLVTAPPSAPYIYSVSSGPQSLSIYFNAPAPGSSPITNYTLLSVLSPSGTLPIDLTLPASQTSPIVITSLIDGQLYSFTLAATNAVGVSAPSPASSPASPCTAPVAPTAPTLQASLVTSGAVTVSFVPPASFCPLTACFIKVQTAAGIGLNTVTTLQTSFTFTNLPVNQVISAVVQCSNALGNSPFSLPGATITVPEVYVSESAACAHHTCGHRSTDAWVGFHPRRSLPLTLSRDVVCFTCVCCVCVCVCVCVCCACVCCSYYTRPNGTCSSPCNGGQQDLSLFCALAENSAQTAPLASCSSQTKPLLLGPCNTQPCDCSAVQNCNGLGACVLPQTCYCPSQYTGPSCGQCSGSLLNWPHCVSCPSQTLAAATPHTSMHARC